MQDARERYEQLMQSFEQENQLSASLAAELQATKANEKQLATKLESSTESSSARIQSLEAQSEDLSNRLQLVTEENEELSSKKEALDKQVTISPCLFGKILHLGGLT